MAFPAYRSKTETGVTSASNTVSIAAPAGVTATDYQIVVVSVSSGSVALAVSPPAGWTLLSDDQVTSPTSPDRGGTQRVGLYEISPSATSTQRSAAFAMTMTGTARIWSGVRVAYSVPAGSTGRTVALSKTIDPNPTATTSKPLPAITNGATDSLAIGVGAGDFSNTSIWTSTGTYTQRSLYGNGSTSEFQYFAIGDAQVAASASPSATFVLSPADEAAVYHLILNGTSGATAPTVGAGTDVASHLVNTAFARTATESGSGITARAWTIVSGPAGAGTTIGTAAALSWTPTVTGTYVLRYSATNPTGTGTDDVSIIVDTGTPGTLTSSWVGIDKIGLVLSGGTGVVRVDFSATSDMASPVSSSSVTPDGLGNAQVTLPALTANTLYYYRAFRGAAYIGTATQFRTLPTSGGFTFAFASCRSHIANEPSPNPTALSDMRTRGAQMFLQTGDIHYRDISANDPPSFRTGFDELYTRSNFAALLQTVPTAYIWSDHDYGGDASYSGTASKPAAQQVYRERVPSPTLPSVTGGIYHTFVVGRVRIIMLDTRSYRSQWTATDNSSKTMLGTEQKTWLQNLLATVTEPITFVVSDVGWIGGGGEDDHWGAYNTERTEIAPWISGAATEVVMLCGDAHMLAIDNGTNAAGGCHVWHAAALNRFTSTKGGPYSGGTLPGNNQYGYVTVTDSGVSISVTYQGIESDTTVWNSDTVTVNTPVASAGAFLPFF